MPGRIAYAGPAVDRFSIRCFASIKLLLAGIVGYLKKHDPKIGQGVAIFVDDVTCSLGCESVRA